VIDRLSPRRVLRTAAAIASLAGLAACTGGTEYTQTTFHPVTQYGELLNAVFLNTFWWTMGILVLVLALIIYVVFRFRERPGMPRPKQIHGNTQIEILWTIVPAIIVVFIAVPTVQTIFETQRRASEEALTIEVIGHQWWWEFVYPEQGVRTANVFYVPVGRQIHLQMHSADVVHSFWVPRLGGKRDVVPLASAHEGQQPKYNHIVFTVDSAGTYSGQCAEFCGEAHAIMMTTAVAVQSDEFDEWVTSMQHAPPAPPPAPDTVTSPVGDTSRVPQTPAGQPVLDPLAEQGRAIFLRSACVACHAISNTTAQGRVGPNLTRFGLRPTVGAGARPNTQENIEAWIRNPRALKAGTLMPGTQQEAAGFPPTGLSDEEVRAVAAYLRSLN
jgi:cytochrome c oxidase subunit 2